MGSKTGWIVALALVLVVVVVAYLVILAPQPSLPRESNEDGFLDLKAVDIPLVDAIGVTPSEPGNAAADYQKAVSLWITHGSTIEDAGDAARQDALIASQEIWSDPAMQACRQIAEHVAAGAKKEKMEYSFVYSPKTLRVAFHHPHSDHLFKVAVSVNLLYGIHKERKEYAEAEKCLRNMFILGWHMVTERRLAEIERTGVEIMTDALPKLKGLYSVWAGAPKHRLPAIEKYAEDLVPISFNYRRKKKILWDNIPGRNPATGEPMFYAGDVFHIAQNDKDPAWRAQAVIALGPLKHIVTSRGDIKKTRNLISLFLLSKDPIVEAAAKAADAMDVEAFRSMGSDFGDEDESQGF